MPKERAMRSRTVGSSSITNTTGPVAAGAVAENLRMGCISVGCGVSETSAGSETVNVEPSPGWLVTVMSPPMSRQNLRLMARPSPVPPNLRVVEASA